VYKLGGATILTVGYSTVDGLLDAKFHLVGAGVGVLVPKTVNFRKFSKALTGAYRLACAPLTKFFVVCDSITVFSFQFGRFRLRGAELTGLYLSGAFSLKNFSAPYGEIIDRIAKIVEMQK